MHDEKLFHRCQQLLLLNRFGYNNRLFIQQRIYPLKKYNYFYHDTCMAHVRCIKYLFDMLTFFQLFPYFPKLCKFNTGCIKM